MAERFPRVDKQIGGLVDFFFGGVPAQAEAKGAYLVLVRHAHRRQNRGADSGTGRPAGPGGGADLGHPAEHFVAGNSGKIDAQGVRQPLGLGPVSF